MKFFIKPKLLYVLFSFFFIAFATNAGAVTIDASQLLSRTQVLFSPQSGSFVEGSTFQVPILVNTKGKSINAIEIRVNFDKDKLFILNPTGGTSIIGVWVEPPGYDNARGTASYVGVIPNGIIAEASLIGTITFKAKAVGRAAVSINSNSKILLNDGLGTETIVEPGRAEYTILPKAPGGVEIYSQTHPVQSDWHNNNGPVISWMKDAGVTGFSFILDNKPNTIPDDTVDSEDTTQAFAGLNDGLYYFHIKASKNGAWSKTGDFLLRIDTVPPAKFKPEANYLVAALVSVQRTLVSFFTTDNLSGIDHYEVGIIDKNQPLTESPVFVQAESPFQVPLSVGGKLQVIIRAIDKAGNVRDESIDVRTPFAFYKFLEDNMVYILSGIILLGLILFLIYFLAEHHTIRHIRHVLQLLKKEKAEEVPPSQNNDIIR